MQRLIISGLSALVVLTGFSSPAVAAQSGRLQTNSNDHYACSYRYRDGNGDWVHGYAGGNTRFQAKNAVRNILEAKELETNSQSFESDQLFCRNVLGN